VACVYNLRDEVSLFLEEENLVHYERPRKEYFVSELIYLSDVFEKFVTVNTLVQGNDSG
jgi:hypothetical protein